MKTRSRRGTGLVESCMAAVILVPLALCLLDLICIVMGNSMNDTAAKNAARAGANQTDGGLAFAAAQKSIAFKPSAIISDLSIANFDYSVPKGTVTCETKVVVHPPVPFPGFGEVSFVAQDVEPILAKNE